MMMVFVWHSYEKNPLCAHLCARASHVNTTTPTLRHKTRCQCRFDVCSDDPWCRVDMDRLGRVQTHSGAQKEVREGGRKAYRDAPGRRESKCSESSGEKRDAWEWSFWGQNPTSVKRRGNEGLSEPVGDQQLICLRSNKCRARARPDIIEEKQRETLASHISLSVVFRAT